MSLDAYQDRLPPEVLVEARVLGPVEVVGWRVPPDRQVVTELCCYLALHDGRPVPGDTLRMALWPEGREASAKSLRTYVSLLRRSLGADLFPEAEKGAGYELDDAVTSDWQRFCDQVADADRCTRQGDADLSTLLLRRALQFVRGIPFAGVNGNSFSWAWSELVVAEMERTVADVGERVAVAALGSEHLDLAEWALRRALLGVPFAEGLWDLRVEVATRQGPFALNRVRRDRRAVLGEDPDADTNRPKIARRGSADGTGGGQE